MITVIPRAGMRVSRPPGVRRPQGNAAPATRGGTQTRIVDDPVPASRRSPGPSTASAAIPVAPGTCGPPGFDGTGGETDGTGRIGHADVVRLFNHL